MLMLLATTGPRECVGGRAISRLGREPTRRALPGMHQPTRGLLGYVAEPTSGLLDFSAWPVASASTYASRASHPAGRPGEGRGGRARRRGSAARPVAMPSSRSRACRVVYSCKTWMKNLPGFRITQRHASHGNRNIRACQLGCTRSMTMCTYRYVRRKLWG